VPLLCRHFGKLEKAVVQALKIDIKDEVINRFFLPIELMPGGIKVQIFCPFIILPGIRTTGLVK